MVEECMIPVGIEDCEGIIDVCDTAGLSVGFEDVLLVLNEIAEVGFETALVTLTLLV